MLRESATSIWTPTLDCQTFEPEEHAPIAAVVEPALIVVYYRMPSGHLGQVISEQLLTGAQFSLRRGSAFQGVAGAPNPVFARGKPSAVYAPNAGGEYVFVRGSDNALWTYHNGQWQWLDGIIYGDPSAVSWNDTVRQRVRPRNR